MTLPTGAVMKNVTFLYFFLLFALTSPAWAVSGNDNGYHQKPKSVELQSWSIKIDAASKRFVILDAFDDSAVLDKETQLVWERS